MYAENKIRDKLAYQTVTIKPLLEFELRGKNRLSPAVTLSDGLYIFV